jgi:antitoxin ParD1/3/4
MDDIRISLSDSTKALVDEELAAGHYASVAECVDALLDAGAKALAQEKLEALLLEGLESGDPVEWMPELMDEIRKEARRPAS